MTPTRPRPSSLSSILVVFCIILFDIVTAHATNDGRDVVVIYNSSMPESKDIADHYAQMRGVPTNQLIGFDLPKSETISRKQYREQLQDPLLKVLEKQELFTFGWNSKLKDAKFRYFVLCYGVPWHIKADPSIKEKISDPKLTGLLTNNAASVDSELAVLPWARQKLLLSGPLVNPVYRGTNTAIFDPTNGVVMVARLDGPTPEIARALVDKAITAERDGLWGRAYFDLRGMTNKIYGAEDTNFLTAAEVAQRTGFDTVLDRNPQTFSAAYPMSQIALYAGWYEENVSGPFTRAKVEFMPGAFAYHLHSYNAADIRSTTTHWAGPLLAKGATATMGAVDEPLLGGLPDMSIFFTRWLMLNLTYGESAYSSLAAVSWQAIVIGDPLYRPLRKAPQKLHEELSKSGSKLIEWSHLKIVNINLVMGSPIGEMIQYLQNEPATKTSAVLTEKLGDLFQMQGKTEDSIAQYRKALELSPTPQQEVRLRLLIMNKSLMLGKRQDVPEELEQFKKHCADYPELTILEQQVKNALSDPAPK